jgi:hypothetical protein
MAWKWMLLKDEKNAPKGHGGPCIRDVSQSYSGQGRGQEELLGEELLIADVGLLIE